MAFGPSGFTSDRGFSGYRFADLYEQECSIQESSLATTEAIWLGLDRQGGRMHLDRERARWLIDRLHEFVEQGTL